MQSDEGASFTLTLQWSLLNSSRSVVSWRLLEPHGVPTSYAQVACLSNWPTSYNCWTSHETARLRIQWFLEPLTPQPHCVEIVSIHRTPVGSKYAFPSSWARAFMCIHMYSLWSVAICCNSTSRLPACYFTWQKQLPGDSIFFTCHPKIMFPQIFKIWNIHGSSKVEIPSVLLLLELSTLRVQYLLPIASFPSPTAAVELRHQKTEEAQPVRSASSRVNRVNSYAASNHGMINIR